MKTFETARVVLGLIELLAWFGLLLSILYTVQHTSEALGYTDDMLRISVAAAPGVIGAVVSLLFIVFVQGARANVETAEWTGQILAVSRQQLDISQRALMRGPEHPASLGDLTPTEGAKPSAFSASQPPVAASFATLRQEPPVSSKPTLAPPQNDPEVLAGRADGVLQIAGATVTVENGTYYLNGAVFTSLEAVLAKLRIVEK